MNLLVLLLLVLPFACLALLSLVAFLGVAAIAGALHLIGVTRSALGIAEQKDADPFNAAMRTRSTTWRQSDSGYGIAMPASSAMDDRQDVRLSIEPERRRIATNTFVVQNHRRLVICFF